jgi:hypothetical protein
LFGSLPNKQASMASDFYQTSKHKNCHICKYLQVFSYFLGGVWAVLIGCESRFLVLSFGVLPGHLNSDATTLAPPINTTINPRSASTYGLAKYRNANHYALYHY